MNQQRVWYYEVSFAHPGEKARWITDPRRFKTFVEAQQAAMDSGERPYRIKDAYVNRPEESPTKTASGCGISGGDS